jgi:hypothetical protein
MYKKRLRKWGLLKFKKRPGSAASETSTAITLSSSPLLTDSDAVGLVFLTKIRDWTTSYFQGASVSSKCTRHFENVHHGVKLAVELFARGYGTSAGQVVRMAFLQLEDVLSLDPPAMIWNLTELMYTVAVQRQLSLFHILLNYLLGLASRHHSEAHPFVQMLLSLHKEASSPSSCNSIPLLLSQAAVLNAEITLVKHIHPHYIRMYQTLIWDNCSIRFPDRVRARASPGFRQPEPSLDPTRQRSLATQRGLSRLAASNLASVQNLSQLDFDDPKIAPCIAAGRIRAALEPTSVQEASGQIPEIHAWIAASMNNYVARMYAKEGAFDESAERFALAVSLLEYSFDACDSRVLWSMWQLENALNHAKRYSEAAAIRKDCMSRVSRSLVNFF